MTSPSASPDGSGVGAGAPPRGHVLLLDGWQHRRAPGHWQGWLAQELVDRGWTVDYPTLPEPSKPSQAAWSAVITAALQRDPGCTVIAHGLSALSWLHLSAQGPRGVPQASRVLLVAPPAPGAHGGDVSAELPGATGAALSVRPPLLVFATDDPFCVPDAGFRYGGPLGLGSVEVAGGGHLNAAAGFGAWPEVLEWVLSGVWPEPSLRHTLELLHRPAGRRLGIAVSVPAPDELAAAAAGVLELSGVTAARRLAFLRPRVGETSTRPDDAVDFVRRYGHEYTVLAVAPELGTPELRSACAQEGCRLLFVSSASSVSSADLRWTAVPLEVPVHPSAALAASPS